jgi:DNA-binding Lrp family transcriptional regulator
MSRELLENKELQALLSSLREGETLEDGRDQPLGKYGRMAMRHLHETEPQRFSCLMMTGELMDMMYRVDAESSDRVEAIIQRLLEKDPLPQTDDILEKTRHFNTKRSIAEELVISEMVLIPR